MSESCNHKATAGASDGFVYCCKCAKIVGSMRLDVDGKNQVVSWGPS